MLPHTQITIENLKLEEQNSIQTLQSDKLDLSILQHGILVSQYYLELYSHLQFNNKLTYTWKLPEWLYENKEFILNMLLPLSTLTTYQIYHDIGKPYCKIYDLEDKKYHFPEHAKISSKTYERTNGSQDLISILIERDMDIHLIKAKDLDVFIGDSKLDHMIAISLLLTGLAEIHANAEMFGGIDSTSFKIKYKQIDSRGKQIIKKIKG